MTKIHVLSLFLPFLPLCTSTYDPTFFEEIFNLANTNPQSYQDLFENEQFLHAAAVTQTTNQLHQSSTLEHATNKVYTDSCIWQILDNIGHSSSFTRPSNLLQCNTDLISNNSNRPATTKATPSPPLVKTDSPPYPTTKRSRKWLETRYQKHYATATKIKTQSKTVGFRDWLDENGDVAYTEEELEELDLENETEDNDPTSTPTLTRRRKIEPYDPDLDTILQSVTIRQVSESPKVYVIDNFASEEEMDYLFKINTEWSYNKKKHDSTGQSFEMPINIDPVPYRISQRMSALLKMNNDMGGTLRTRLYNEGESHPPHVDWFEIDLGTGDETKKSNLIATAMLNLKTTRRGGETEFVDAQPTSVKVPPVRGQLVLWWSCTKEAVKDQHSLHQGNEIKRGTKFTVTQFFYNPLSSCLNLEDFYKPVESLP